MEINYSDLSCNLNLSCSDLYKLPLVKKKKQVILNRENKQSAKQKSDRGKNTTYN